MNRDPILVRVDATLEQGFERFARCMIVAAALQRRRRPTFFLSQLEPTSLAFTIKRGGNEWIDACNPAGSTDDLEDVIQEIRRRRPAAVIVDEANVTHEYLSEIASTGVMVVSLDHQANIRFPSQIVVNPLLGPNRESYEFYPGTQLLLNQRYTLVRPEVRRLRQGRAQEPAALLPPNGKPGATLFRALVALGEDDPNRRVMDYAKLLLNNPRVGRVDIVVRREHPDLEKIQSLVEANKDRLELALEPAEIAARILRAHFALTSGSGWSNELACVGIPQLLIVQNEAHWHNAQIGVHHDAMAVRSEAGDHDAGFRVSMSYDLLHLRQFDETIHDGCGPIGADEDIDVFDYLFSSPQAAADFEALDSGKLSNLAD